MNKLVNTLTLVLILSGGMAGQFSVLGLADEDAPYSGDVSNGGRFVAASYNSVPILWDGVARCTAVLTSGNFVKAICLGSSDFLLVREDNGQSLIEHWRTIAGQLSVVSSVTRGFEAMDLAYDPINGILYWADRARAVIEFAVWSPSVPLATSPWTLLLDSGSAPGHVLGHLPVRFQWLPPTSGSLPPVLFLGEPSWLTHWGIMLNGAPFQLQPVAVDLAAQTRSLFPSGRPHLDPLSISEGKLDARVWGAPGQAVEVVRDLTGVVIGSGAVSLGSTEVTIALTEAPVIGEIYYARLQGSADVPGASPCLKRYSNLGVSASGLSFRPLIWPSGLAIGNSGFHFFAKLNADPAPIQDLEVSGLGLAGFAARSSAGADPLIMIPQGLTIDPAVSAYIPIFGGFRAGRPEGILAAPIPIPADPSLSGHVVLLQMAIDDGTGLLLSDVIAVKIP